MVENQIGWVAAIMTPSVVITSALYYRYVYRLGFHEELTATTRVLGYGFLENARLPTFESSMDESAASQLRYVILGYPTFKFLLVNLRSRHSPGDCLPNFYGETLILFTVFEYP